MFAVPACLSPIGRLPHFHSHVVKSLKFGTQFPARGRRAVTEPGVQLEGLSALEDRVYTIDALHTAPHHYIKVGRFLVRPRLGFLLDADE